MNTLDEKLYLFLSHKEFTLTYSTLYTDLYTEGTKMKYLLCILYILIGLP